MAAYEIGTKGNSRECETLSTKTCTWIYHFYVYYYNGYKIELYGFKILVFLNNTCNCAVIVQITVILNNSQLQFVSISYSIPSTEKKLIPN
jgi:hypothetical protein